MRVFGVTADHGQRAQGVLTVGRLAYGGTIDLPVLLVRGANDGPLLWLNGVVHGDEINGVFVMRNLFASLDVSKLRGAIMMTPVSNPVALGARSKVSPYDFLDMDQQFPGQASGQLSQRIAHTLVAGLDHAPDCVVSFHTLATAYEATVYTNYRAMPSVASDVEARASDLALSFGADTVCRLDVSRTNDELPGNVTGSLDSVCLMAGIPAFMAELGGGGRVDAGAVARGEAGITNVLKHLGMVDGTPRLPPEQRHVTKRSFVYADDGGLFVADIAAGQVCAAGASLGSILDVTDGFASRTAHAPSQDSLVIAIRRDPVVHTGDRIALLGTGWETIRNTGGVAT